MDKGMSNFIKMVYAKLNEAGIETKELSADEAVKKYNELEKGEKQNGKNEGERNSKQEDTGTEAEKQKLKDKGIENAETEKQEQVENRSREERLAGLKEEFKKKGGLFGAPNLLTEIRALESGFDTVEAYLEDKARKLEGKIARKAKQAQSTLGKAKREERERQSRKEQLEKDIKEAPEEKRKQFEIIQKYNPLQDDYHVGIRSPKDIKSFAETIEDEDSFIYGDFSKEDAKLALKTGKITVYSSHPINQGTFVSTSKKQAEDYAGGTGKKLYTQEIQLDKIAWINGNEGQFADITQN